MLPLTNNTINDIIVLDLFQVGQLTHIHIASCDKLSEGGSLGPSTAGHC